MWHEEGGVGDIGSVRPNFPKLSWQLLFLPLLAHAHFLKSRTKSELRLTNCECVHTKVKESFFFKFFFKFHLVNIQCNNSFRSGGASSSKLNKNCAL